jgi:hypothetical protein
VAAWFVAGGCATKASAETEDAASCSLSAGTLFALEESVVEMSEADEPVS